MQKKKVVFSLSMAVILGLPDGSYGEKPQIQPLQFPSATGTVKVRHYCSFRGAPDKNIHEITISKPEDSPEESPDKDLLAIANEILDSIGAGRNYVIKTSRNVDYATASLEMRLNSKGTDLSPDEKYVIYNPIYLSGVRRRTNSRWFPYLVFAHEFGHHVEFHTVSLDSSPTKELDADRYAGRTLNNLGMTRAELAILVPRALEGEERGDNIHPPLDRRLKAFLQGWDNGEKIRNRQALQGIIHRFQQNRDRAFLLGCESAFAFGFCVKEKEKGKSQTPQYKIDSTRAQIETFLEDLKLSQRISFPLSPNVCSDQGSNMQAYALHVASSLRAKDLRLQKAFELGWYGINKLQSRGVLFPMELPPLAIEAGYASPELIVPEEKYYLESLMKEARTSLRME